MNSAKESDVKNWTYNFFDDIINIRNLDLNKIKIDEKSYKNILIYCVGYMTPNSVKPLWLIINKINGYIEESNRNKYLALARVDKSKDTLKKYEILLDQHSIAQMITIRNIWKSNLILMAIYL